MFNASLFIYVISLCVCVWHVYCQILSCSFVCILEIVRLLCFQLSHCGGMVSGRVESGRVVSGYVVVWYVVVWYVVVWCVVVWSCGNWIALLLYNLNRDKVIQVDMIFNYTFSLGLRGTCLYASMMTLSSWRAPRATSMGILEACVKTFPSKSKTKHIA